jgi:hypothetical protein
MSFWNAVRSGSGSSSESGGLKPIVQKVPMPAVMPARVATAKPKESFEQKLEAAKAPPPKPPVAAKPVVAPPPAPAPAIAAPPVLPKATALDPEKLRRAMAAPPSAPAPAAPSPSKPPAVFGPLEAISALRRAVVAQTRGDHAGAVAEFTKALEHDGACVEALTGRGISREALGDVDGARKDYAKGIEIEVRAELDRQRRSNPDWVA